MASRHKASSHATGSQAQPAWHGLADPAQWAEQFRQWQSMAGAFAQSGAPGSTGFGPAGGMPTGEGAMPFALILPERLAEIQQKYLEAWLQIWGHMSAGDSAETVAPPTAALPTTLGARVRCMAMPRPSMSSMRAR